MKCKKCEKREADGEDELCHHCRFGTVLSSMLRKSEEKE